MTNDWGSGYCGTLDVTNNASEPTISWEVTLNTLQSSLYTSWNADFSDSSGSVAVTPLAWNSVIAPGATDSSVGFCAERSAGSSDTAVVEGATGTY